jgi:hypothetical protein
MALLSYLLRQATIAPFEIRRGNPMPSPSDTTRFHPALPAGQSRLDGSDQSLPKMRVRYHAGNRCQGIE